jgi:prepilin-type N-terminal cleavage/methylation domain-containing protein
MGGETTRCSQSAFTLVEVMLSLALFALLATILYGAVSLGQGAVQKSQRSFEKNQSLRSALDLLASYVRSSYPYKTAPSDPSIAYTGEETEVSFVSAFSLAMGGRGLARIHVSWAGEGEAAGPLTLEEQVPVSQEGGAYTNAVTVADNVSGLRLSYLSWENDKQEWLERWDPAERKTLPRAVRLNFKDEEAREVEWIFPIMLSVMTP